LKASLSWLGLDSTSSLRNRENVDCIIHLTNSLFNPDVKFSIRLPDVDTQIEQAFYTVLDTTNDALMTQQMISLLVLGSFSYSSGGKFSIENSSFDMLSGQISGLLSQISKDFVIGVRYRPGDQLTSEELEVALSTQLFNDRVSIDGNFGMIYNQTTTQNASNIVGDVDVRVKLTPDGRFQLKAFNHSNNNAWLTSGDFDNYAPYTQGIGVSYRQEFDQFGEIFRRKKQKKQSQKKP
ncbi:MAG: translocation/assembly module TamB domain-containing protein, partial [Ignavibacteria bacterium]|nr:translocation/assembly module TamB domain-containing protein [Ignavibacteria bacterium]